MLFCVVILLLTLTVGKHTSGEGIQNARLVSNILMDERAAAQHVEGKEKQEALDRQLQRRRL